MKNTTPSESLKRYFDSIPPRTITHQEERELIARAHAGDRAAFDKVVEQNLRLVGKNAQNFAGLADLEDLVAAGNTGLLKAVRKFDPSVGAKFSSYAKWWIDHAMRKHISAEHGMSRQAYSKIAQVHRVLDETGSDGLSYESLRDETAEKLGCRPHRSTIQAAVNFTLQPVSLDEEIEGSDDRRRDEITADPESDFAEKMCRSWEIQRMMDCLEKLEPRQRQVVLGVFGLDGQPRKKQNELSKEMGCTRQRVQQILQDSLRQMKKLIECEQ